MKILGVHYSHDSGAAIIEDGKIIAAVNEERLNRKKMYWGIPLLSINEVFRLSGFQPKDIDFIAYANMTPGGGPQRSFGEPNLRKKAHDVFSQTLPFIAGSKYFAAAYRNIFSKFRRGKSVLAVLRQIGVEAPVRYIDHHLCHAASAYYTSQFDKDTLVVTTDGTGDGLCSTVNTVSDDYELQKVASTPTFHTPAGIYASCTYNMGFTPNKHEGKLTGLAAYGNVDKTYPIFRSIMDVDGLSYKIRGITYGRPGARKIHLLMQHQKREDIAAGLQKRFEEVGSTLIKNALEKYPRKHIALAGGAYANVRLNQQISLLPGVEKVYIHPHMGDGGLAVGAALALWADLQLEKGIQPKPIPIDTVYFGPSYTDEQIETDLKSAGLKYKFSKNIEQDVAQMLVKKKIVGRFDGRMEYGPRALGNRSIVADPTDKTINDWLNNRLKRTEFMPFAPSLLREYAEDAYTNFNQGEIAAKFMTVTFNIKNGYDKKASAVAHVDNTARPQTVTKEQNPSYYKLLKIWHELSGLPIFINTSFNMHEEPIVCSPNDAIRSLKVGAVDYLAIGNFIAEAR